MLHFVEILQIVHDFLLLTAMLGSSIIRVNNGRAPCIAFPLAVDTGTVVHRVAASGKPLAAAHAELAHNLLKLTEVIAIQLPSLLSVTAGSSRRARQPARSAALRLATRVPWPSVLPRPGHLNVPGGLLHRQR